MKKLASVVGSRRGLRGGGGAGGAAPAVCTADVVHQTLIAAGKLTQQDIDEFGVKVDLLRCGDVTNDGASDALFTLASGGTGRRHRVRRRARQPRRHGRRARALQAGPTRSASRATTAAAST
jgi:hypothetical protein